MCALYTPELIFTDKHEQWTSTLKVEVELETEEQTKPTKEHGIKNKVPAKNKGNSQRPSPVKKPAAKSKTPKNNAEFDLHIQNLRTIMRCSNATPLRLLGKWYTCSCCPERFDDPAALKRHTANKHPDGQNASVGRDMAHLVIRVDITDLQCKLCDTKLDDVEKLTEHLMKDHSEKIHSLEKNYIVPFKFDSRDLKCVICEHEFHNFKTLVQHMNTHIPNFVCDSCGNGFVNERSLINHVRLHPNGQHKCKTCQRVFNNHLKLKEHEKFVHLGLNKRNKCDYCNERFNGTIAKKIHMIKNHGEPEIDVKCPACDKHFKSHKYLAIHKRTFHMMEKRHKCPECDKMFFSTDEVRKHMLTHTGQRDFQCIICKKSYGRKGTLKEHMRIHADDRRFKCEHCEMTFIQKCSWRGHMRSKHGEDV